ncbi:MAG: hypothetical protein ACJAQ2_002547 [Vicingaceae bacterium]|jgi:hypothetical protein
MILLKFEDKKKAKGNKKDFRTNSPPLKLLPRQFPQLLEVSLYQLYPYCRRAYANVGKSLLFQDHIG